MGFLKKGAVKFVGVLLAILALVVGVLRLFFVDPVTVAHNAMAPTLIHGDLVLLWRGAAVNHGDIVVCRHPHEDRYVMGRVMGTNGMAISSLRGQLAINGTVPAHDYRGTIPFFDTTTERIVTMRWGIEELGNNSHYFFEQDGRTLRVREVGAVRGIHLVGDNRAYQDEDSRDFGDVDPATCIGDVFFRLRPAEGVDLGTEIDHGWFEFLD